MAGHKFRYMDMKATGVNIHDLIKPSFEKNESPG
jgi:hypothetical protein